MEDFYFRDYYILHITAKFKNNNFCNENAARNCDSNPQYDEGEIEMFHSQGLQVFSPGLVRHLGLGSDQTRLLQAAGTDPCINHHLSEV